MTNQRFKGILIRLFQNNYVTKFPCSRGASGALYLQSALAGVMFCLGYFVVEQPYISGVDVWVLRNRNL